MQERSRCCLFKRSKEQVAKVKNKMRAKIYQSNRNRNVGCAKLFETKYVSRNKKASCIDDIISYQNGKFRIKVSTKSQNQEQQLIIQNW